MRVLMFPTDFLPHSVGGSEVYVYGLSRGLMELNVEVRVAFHVVRGRPEPGFYKHGEVAVHALPPLPPHSREQIYGCTTHSMPGYLELLAEFKPDIVHFHDFSSHASLDHMRAAKSSGARVVLSYHTPGMSCLQRSLLRNGSVPCDGRIEVRRCTTCRLRCSGTPPVLAHLAGAVDFGLLGPVFPGPMGRLVTGRKVTARFQRAWASMLQQVDRIHVHADWARDLFLANGAKPETLRMCRTGLTPRASLPPDDSLWRYPRDEKRLRVFYFGRIEPVKGVGVLVQAILRLPKNVPVEVLFVGGGSESQNRHRRMLEGQLHGESRVTFAGRRPPETILAIARTADVCVIPSVWLETGPLTVLEAWAAGLPVIGSRLGGIAELVEGEKGGILFPPGDAGALAAILWNLAEDRASLQRLRAAVPEPRTMQQVSKDVLELYRGLPKGMEPVSSTGASR